MNPASPHPESPAVPGTAEAPATADRPDATSAAIESSPQPEAPVEAVAAEGPAPAEPRAADAADAAAPAPDLSPAATGTRLAALFPALFVGPEGRGVWKPIKLRIHADIQARAPGQFSKRTLGIFFSRYTTTTPYLKALAADGAQRYDLDGEPAGEISAEHRQLAAEEVARRQAIAAERRAAMRPPRQASPPGRTESAETRARPHADPPSQHHADSPAERPQREAGRPARPRDRDAVGSDRGRQRGPRAPHAEASQLSRDRPPPGERSPPHAGRKAEPASRDARAAALPMDPAQRDRAMLLRAFEASPLSKANFCALKQITEAELDAVLRQAQAEGPRR